MKNIFSLLAFLLLTSLYAENNQSNITKDISQENNQTIERNTTQPKSTLQKEVEEQIKREEKYAKEQKFYQGEEYDLSSAEVNSNIVDKVNAIEPDLDFDMDDVYRDDI